MREIVASAVASEAVSRISSLVSGARTASSHQSAKDRAERLEMAVLKIQSIVAVCEDLQITHLPLLQWKAKLKRVAVEGDSLLHAHKKKTLERSKVAGTSTTSSLSRHMIPAAKRFVPFLGGRSEDCELSDMTLQRFERLADGADSFFRLVVESSSSCRRRRPERSLPPLPPSLTQSLLAGNSVEFCLQGPGTGSSDLVLLWPWRDPDAEDQLQAYLMVSHEDEVTWQRNLKPVIRVTTFCYALPAAMDDKSCKPLALNNNGGIPLKLACHVSPYLLPEKHSSQFLQVEQNAILETMLPKVEESFYDDQRQALVECKRDIWCPQTAMYCSVAPEITQPLTMSKAYLTENSGASINRRKRRKSHAMSK